MSFLFQKQDPLNLLPENGLSKPLGTFSENLSAAFESARANDQAYSEATVLRDQWGPIVDTINERAGMDAYSEFLGVKIRTFMHDGFTNPANNISSSILNAPATPGNAENQYMRAAQGIVDYLQENKDLFPDLQWVTHEEVLRRGMEVAQRERETLQDLEGRSPGFGNAIARFTGALGGLATDPINVETAFVGGAARSLYGAIFREAMLGAGVEAMSQAGVQEWYRTLGYEYTPQQFWTAVAMGGAFGGAMPVAFRAGGKTISLTTDQLKRGYQALRDSGAFTPTPVTRTAERQAEILEEEAAINPLADDAVHQERMEQATVATEMAEPAAMPDTPPVPLREINSVYEADNLDGLVYRFDPDEILVDADLFQFKAGGDEYGVSDRLRGIKIWDPVKAGQIVVYEFADGRRFIADGHQRLGLARRIKAEDPTQDVRLYGNIIREVDGITPEMARVIAAMKNIAEGTGTAIDAAKVLRVAPERIGELPPKSVLVRQAQGLTLLSDEAFGAVINGVVPANYAALVGRLIPEDEGLQSSAISVLAKTDPANEFQAEAIVRQVRDAGAERITQASLFGEEVITESYFTERARILDRAQKQLRQDKAAFGTLVRNAERLEAEGNQLARSANERRANNDTQAIALLQALANRKGPVSDALNAAARAARERGSYAEPTRNFVDAVRLAAESGDFDRISTGDVGQLIDGPTQSRTSKDVAERAVEDFDEPGGQGVRDQADQLQTDIFGAEPPAEVQRVSPIEEDRVPPEEIRMPIDDNLPPDQIRAEVQRLTNENIAIVKDLIARVDEKFGTKSGDNVKALSKVTQKANRPSILAKKPWHKVSHIRDSYRFKTVIDDIRDVPAIFDELLATGISLVKIDTGKLFEPKEWGWRIIAFDLRMPNGQLVEWYLPIKELEAQKKAEGHLIFEEWRNKTPEEMAAQVNEYAAAVAKSFKGYDDAFQASLDRMGISREDAAASWAKAESSMLEAARKSPSSSGMITSSGVRGVETQVPSRVRMAQEPSVQKSQALDVSSSISAKSTSVTEGAPQIEVTAAGEQALMPGIEPITDIARAQAQMGRPMRGGEAALPEGGLFDEGARAQQDMFSSQDMILDLDEEIPVDLRVDPETGEITAQTVTLRQIQDDIAQDVKMLDRLRGCAK